jgi:hypothetical protein
MMLHIVGVTGNVSRKEPEHNSCSVCFLNTDSHIDMLLKAK